MPELNDQPLPYLHGKPLRLRNELQHGFKLVKWIKGIEFVADYSAIGGAARFPKSFARRTFRVALERVLNSRRSA
jgi:DMSO/TMAO reductase YedYZ molybdopterin-dependent catalytic subunit